MSLKLKQELGFDPDKSVPISGPISGPIVVDRDNVHTLSKNMPFHVSSILKTLTKIKSGALSVQLPDGKIYRFQSGQPGPDADITLHNWNPPKRALMGGSIGIAESYMDQEWDSSDVTSFLELFSINYDLGNQLTNPSFMQTIIERLRHWLNTNTKRGSKKNISAHYDLGNDFYSLWLDRSMTYSSAIYNKDTNSLEAAQNAKYKSLADRLDIKSGDHVLEIGCGWGGFAEYVAKHRDANITGLTISREQFEYANKRISNAGLSEKVKLKFQDYRDETSTYDKIASIEMFEAVGEKYWDTYFSKVSNCLKAGGKAGLQIITISDDSFERYKITPDFIQKYVFPGGMLPSPKALSEMASKVGFIEEVPRIFGQDYARTLADWRVTFWEKWDQVKLLGFDLRFKRMWEFYMHYCEAGFKSGNIDVRQIFYTKPLK